MNKTLLNRLMTSAGALAVIFMANGAAAQTPIAYWDFDDAPGATTLAEGNLDANGTTYDATFAGTDTPTFAQGILGGAWNSGVGSPDNLFQTGAFAELVPGITFSISAWINPDVPSQPYGGIFMTRNASTSISQSGDPLMDDPAGNWGIAVTGSNLDNRVQTGNGASSGQAVGVTPSAWQHVVYVWDATTATLQVYVDNVQTTFDTVSNPALAAAGGAIWSAAGDWTIGGDGTTSRAFDGLIDDLALYNVALTSGQVNTIFTDGQAGTAIDGDMNLPEGEVDGVAGVNQLDLDVILANWGTSTIGNANARSLGDLSNDGFVGLEDFRLWKNAAGPGAGSAVTAPEPSSLLLTVLALSGFAARRRVRSAC